MVEASLLPEPHASIRCAVHARRHAYDPGGTAISAAALLVAELPGPWPKPVFAHPGLHGLTATTATPVGVARILAALPPADRGELRLRRFDRMLDGAFLSTSTAEDAGGLREVIAATVELDSVPADARPVTQPLALVCTQGTHDVCCGIEGTRLALDLEQMGLPVMRVSHTGGHRFAPTALTLPDGRMWAYLDAPLLAAIMQQAIDPAVAAALCRGWWGAQPGAAQVAERAVFAEVGWAWDSMVRSVSIRDQEGESQLWAVTGNGATWQIHTAPRRTVPVPACRASGGLPAKEAVEFEAAIVTRP